MTALVLDTPALTVARARLDRARTAFRAAVDAFQPHAGTVRSRRVELDHMDELEHARAAARADVERALRAANPGIDERRLNNTLREL